MVIRDDYPVVAALHPAQAVLVYDAHFKVIDAICGGQPFEVTGTVTGPKRVRYYRLLRSDWEHNTTDRAFVRAATVALTDNPWKALPHRGRLSSQLRRAVSTVVRRLSRSADLPPPPEAPD